jgi:hypothetical protein
VVVPASDHRCLLDHIDSQNPRAFADATSEILRLWILLDETVTVELERC